MTDVARIEDNIMNRPLMLFAILVAAAGGCTEPDRGGNDVVVQRDTVGDTVFVRTVSGSAWGGPARLELDLRIGALEGADEYVFGDITEIAPDGVGGLYVFDRQVPALRHYDSDEPPPFPFEEPEGFDVFDFDGGYLGEVIVPPGTKLYWIGSDHVLGVHRGRSDEQYVVRLRLETPAPHRG